MKKIISYDLGTGGVKASLYDSQLNTLAKSFIEYKTTYPHPDFHEQAPADWWNGVVASTRKLLQESGVDATSVAGIALSGHSLVTVPIGKNGEELLERVPIWSDTRAKQEAEQFFSTISEESWYLRTGNGFPPPCYSIFKLMWMKKHQPEVYEATNKVLGSKDYINYKMTGILRTDHSYASGTGAYDLHNHQMCPELLEAAGIRPDIFPEIVDSAQIIGSLTEQAAHELGLLQGVQVACGGVDNACMALGSVGCRPGRVYTSLGSSSWIAVNSTKPVLNEKTKPYVFAHIAPGMYTSAFSIFAGGSSLRWVRDTLCKDLLDREDPYQAMTEEMLKEPIGAGGVFFNPSLAGGTCQDKSVHIKGAFLGLNLGTSRGAIIRAAMEGIAMNLKLSLDNLVTATPISDTLQFCGGGSKNPAWMQMFADIFGKKILKTNIDQDAASLGAAAIIARAMSMIDSYDAVDAMHRPERICTPECNAHKSYQKLLTQFQHASDLLADFGDWLQKDA